MVLNFEVVVDPLIFFSFFSSHFEHRRDQGLVETLLQNRNFSYVCQVLLLNSKVCLLFTGLKNQVVCFSQNA